MLINLKITSLVLVTICSMSIVIGNRFHTIRANSGKITSFFGDGEVPLLTPSSKENPFTQGHEILSR